MAATIPSDTAAELATLAVAPASRVLAVGLEEATLAEALVARGCLLWAVAGDEPTARALKPSCEEVLVGDPVDFDLAGTFVGIPFDVIVCLGLLDRVRRPEAVLAAIAAALPAGARTIVSVANATHVDARLAALRPAARPGPAGRLDRAGLEALLGQAGLTPIELLRVVRPPAPPGESVPPEVLAWLSADPEASTAELVAICTGGEGSPAPSLGEHLQRRIRLLEQSEAEARSRGQQLETALAKATAEAARLQVSLEQANAIEADRRARLAELEAVLRQRMAELDSLDHALKLLQADLAVKEAYTVELRDALALADRAAVAANDDNVQLRAAVAAAEAGRDAERAEVIRLRPLADELNRVRARAGYRVLERASATLAGVPLAMTVAKWMARRLARRG